MGADPSQHEGYLLQHVAFLFAKQSDQALQEQLGIGLAQYRILSTLQATPRVTQKEVAFILSQTEASISRQVKLLIEAGLLRLQTNPSDRREHIAELTHKGLRMTEAAREVLSKHHRVTLSILGIKRQNDFQLALEQLEQHLGG